MLQYKIPQNVGIEDKIVGPLTLRQLIILAVGGGMSWVLFAIVSKIYELNFIEYAVVAIPLIIAAAFALIRIHDVAFPKFLLLTLEFALKPKKRVWDARGIAFLAALPLTEEKEGAGITEKIPGKKNVNLHDLSRVLDSGGFNHVQVKEHEELDHAQDEDLMAEAFFGHKKDSTGNMYWRAAKHDRGERLKLLAKLPLTPIKKPEPVLPPKAAVAAPIPMSGAVSPRPTAPSHAAQGVLPPSAPNQAIPAQTAKVLPATPPKPTQKPLTAMPPLLQDFSQIPQKKKRRRRKKKNKNDIARPETMVNAMDKSKPVRFSGAPAPKSPPPPPPPSKPKTETKKGARGEFEFGDLQKGEIEINLD